MRPLPVLALLSLALPVACSDQAVTVIDQPPTATITSPSDGADVAFGEPIVLTGTVGDPDDAASTLLAAWTVDGAPACAEAAPSDDGSTSCTVTIANDTATIALSVRDPKSESATDSVTVSACTAQWYRDSDGDGFGDAQSPEVACAQPNGFVANADDCDDTQADVNPGADDLCDDGVDQDCSGAADDGCLGTNCFDNDDVMTADATGYYQSAGALKATDGTGDDGGYRDDWEFDGTSGQKVAFHAWSDQVDTHVALYDQDCQLYAESADGARGTNAFLEVRLPDAGIWTVVVSSDVPGSTGSYVVEMIPDSVDVGANCAKEALTLDLVDAPYADAYDGELTSSDNLWDKSVGDGFYYDDLESWLFYGDTASYEMSSSQVTPILSLYGADCGLVKYGYVSGGGPADLSATIDRTGIYTITAWAQYSYSYGSYHLDASATF